MQHLIDKLKLVDEVFAKDGWLPEYKYRQLLAEVISELLQKCEQAHVSRSAVADVVLEAEKRVAKCIKDDIELGYDLQMIKGKIKIGSYVGSSVETYRSYKRHFG
jgi:hypothetical protein